MNFYLDFEATRFSNRIISIGCVTNTGATFQTLVKPIHKAKIDKFITELTGITEEMLAEAPSADEAFESLFYFIELNNDKSEPKYYCYGNSDVEFIHNTVKYMTNTKACICAQAIAGNLIDYASIVKKFFIANQDLSLRKVYMLVKSQNELIQKHDALEDALMLQTVVENLYDKCKPEDKNTILAIPSQKRPITTKKAPAIFLEWEQYPHSFKWEVNTKADKNNYTVKCIGCRTNHIKYFDNLETAALWVIKYLACNVSPKNANDINKIKNQIIKACQNNRVRYNCIWQIKKEE